MRRPPPGAVAEIAPPEFSRRRQRDRLPPYLTDLLPNAARIAAVCAFVKRGVPAHGKISVSSVFHPWLNPRVMHNPVIVALDVSKPEAALELVERLAPVVGAFKVGKELFVSAGPEVVRKIRATGASVFLDLKFHDIPNTVAKAVAAAAQLDVQMLTVHASGGSEMLRAAEQAAQANARKLRRAPPLVRGVTVLTSLDRDGLDEIGVEPNVGRQV